MIKINIKKFLIEEVKTKEENKSLDNEKKYLTVVEYYTKEFPHQTIKFTTYLKNKTIIFENIEINSLEMLQLYQYALSRTYCKLQRQYNICNYTNGDVVIGVDDNLNSFIGILSNTKNSIAQVELMYYKGKYIEHSKKYINIEKDSLINLMDKEHIILSDEGKTLKLELNQLLLNLKDTISYLNNKIDDSKFILAKIEKDLGTFEDLYKDNTNNETISKLYKRKNSITNKINRFSEEKEYFNTQIKNLGSNLFLLISFLIPNS